MKNILNYKKPTFWMIIIVVIAAIAVGVRLMANPTSTSQNTEKIHMAEVWAEALKTRNGKPRYEMMSEQMKQKFRQEQIRIQGDNWNFVIGGSSPWVVSYDINVQEDIATIVYHLEDSGEGKYDKTEIITFGRENNRLLIIDSKDIPAEWERVFYFAPTAEMAMQVYKKALLESDYFTLLSLIHSDALNANGQDIWDTIKISDVKVMKEDVRENKAYYQLELDIKDSGDSAFETGVFPRWLWLVKGKNGWHVEGLMTSEPDGSWWKSDVTTVTK